MEKVGRVLRGLGVVVVAGALISLAIFNSSPKIADEIWDARTTLGDAKTARAHYVLYTDLACPYCNVFSRVVMENGEEFVRDYIEGEKVLYEVRLTDFLYEYGEHKPNMSLWGAQGAYCARNQDRFWDYYNAAEAALWDDYYSKGVGVSKTAPEITGMTEEYWLEIGLKLGLGEEFEDCYVGHGTLEEVKANTAKAAKQVNGGVPYFKFGKFTTSGFDQNWGWDYVRRYLDAGL